MKKETANKIAKLLRLQEIEAKNNFRNGDLWNELQDKITNLECYDQENYPDEIKDTETGTIIGYKLNDGTEIL